MHWTFRSRSSRPRARVRAKNGGGKYIAYFQNFTNTYGSLAHMERLFIQALAPEDVVALSVATRPDCLRMKPLRSCGG